jgi:hypothetical protein
MPATFLENPREVTEPFRGRKRFIRIMQDADSKPAAFDASCLPDDLSACHALILEQARVIVEGQQSREGLIQEYTVRREVRKERPEPRQEKFPAHLPRVEETIEPPAEQRECPEHGPKQPIGFDIVETLEFERPKLWVRAGRRAARR